jgi:hypothetical protein
MSPAVGTVGNVGKILKKRGEVLRLGRDDDKYQPTTEKLSELLSRYIQY